MARFAANGVMGLVVVVLGVAQGARADDWPQWRGPRRNAVSAEVGLLTSWPEGGPRLVWKAEGLGTGYSSVVVRRGRVFTIGKHGSDVNVLALDATDGKRIWSRKIASTTRIPCSTPTVNDDLLYALGPDGDLVCLQSASGENVWQKSFAKDFGGRMMSSRGYGESPLVDGNTLVCTPGGADAAIVGLDKRTGAVRWKTKLPDIGSAGADGAGFSSVVVTEAGGLRQYVQLVGRGVIGVDARDGRFLWGYNAIANRTANIPTPVVRNDRVFASNGYDAGSVLLHLVPGEVPTIPAVQAKTVYVLPAVQFQNHHGGMVLVGDHLYGGHGNNNGLPTCLELATGRVMWKRRGPGEGSAAVVYAEGHLYFRYQNGVVALIEANPEGYRLKGTLLISNAGGDSWAHPVIANGLLYLREKDVLWVHDLHRESIAPPDNKAAALPLTDAGLLTLRERGLSLQPLSALRSAKGRRLFGYAADPGDKTAITIITMTAQHLADGKFPDPLLAQLALVREPFALSLAGAAISDAGLAQLGGLDRLVGLDLELCNKITDAGIKAVGRLKDLRVLILAGTNVTEAGIREFATSKHLRALDLEVCDGIANAACEQLGAMRQLRALVLKKTGFEKQAITDAGLRHLKNLSNLEVLDLYGNLFTDAGLVHLGELQKLRELDLSLVAISDRGLAHLKQLRDLERLDLIFSEGFAGPIVTNAGAPSLAGLTKLTTLNLTGARLTDAGLQHLHAATKLKKLQIVNTGVSAAGVQSLRAALPECEIIR